MDEKKEFLILRYSLVEELQNAIEIERIPTPKGAAILVGITQDREFLLSGVRYSFVGFSEIYPTEHYEIPSGRFFIGKTAKLKKAHMGKKVPGDILETQEDDWLPILTVFDLKEQYIFVRKDWRFGTPAQIMRVIQAGLREPVMAKYNHRVFVEGRTRKEHFWRIISNHKRVYKLELKLISPNILETNRKARDALAALKLLFAQDEVSVSLQNESGELKVPKEPVENYLEYIEEGEGSWLVTTDGEHGGKKTYTSANNIDTLEMAIPEEKTMENSQQLELETNLPSQTRKTSKSKMVLEILNKIETYRER